MTFNRSGQNVLLALSLAACTRPPSTPHNVDSADKELQRVANQYGADDVGSTSIVVYARDPDGTPLKGCGADFCHGKNGIRIIIFSQPSRSLEQHITLVKKGPVFSYFLANDGAVSPYGVIEYRPTQSRTVWIQREFGDGPPIDSMQAEFTLESTRSVRYIYKASTEADQVRVYNAVDKYLKIVGLD